MIRIIDNRETGKTGKLMLLAKEYNAIFVCANPDAMKVKAEAYGITGIQFKSYEQFLREEDLYDTNIVIDELEYFISRTLLGTEHLIGYTLSKE